MKNIKESLLYKNLMWLRKRNGFANVTELHNYLMGYYDGESFAKLGLVDRQGSWIHDFMFFCERELNKELNNFKEEWTESIGTGGYSNYIYQNQVNDIEGLKKMFGYLDVFIETYAFE